jgi:hypothetical protein
MPSRLCFRLKREITTGEVALMRCFFAMTFVMFVDEVGL